MPRIRYCLLAIVANLALIGCGPTAPAPSPAVAAPEGVTRPESAGTSAGAGSPVRFKIVPEQSEARYRAREQLAALSLPSEAVAATRDITGAIGLDERGAVVKEQSKFVVDLRNLKSDRTQRDRFIQRNTLETQRFPTASFQPVEVRGLPFPLPASGEASFQLLGELTLREVPRPVTWQITAHFSGGEVTANATTSVTFADFRMERPSVAVVLSVEETIRLELDVKLTKDALGVGPPAPVRAPPVAPSDSAGY